MGDKSTFSRTVRADFKIGLKLPFLLAVFGVILSFCFDNWRDLQSTIHNPLIFKENSPVCVRYFVFNSFSYGGVFSEYFSAIMAAIPFAANYCREAEGGMYIYKISRCGDFVYTCSKFLVASVLGGLVQFLGGLIFILALATYLPLMTPAELLESYGLPFYSALSIGNGILYFVIILYISFLCGALWSSIGLCASAYFPSIYVAVSAPFIFRFVLTEIGRLLKLPSGLRLEMLLSARGQIYSDTVTLAVTTAAVLILIFLCCRLFVKRIKRRIWDGE